MTETVRLRRLVPRAITLAGILSLGVAGGASAQTTYYVRNLPSVNVGADGSTTMTSLVDVTVTGGSSNANRAYTGSTAPTGTNRYRLRQGASTTQTAQEYFRAYTPGYAVATTIAANATAYADFYMNSTGTSVEALATLYEYNDTTGIVGAAKGTASFVGNASTTTRQAMNGVSFGNPQFTVAAGNRLMVVYAFTMSNSRPAYLWGQSSSNTPSGYQSFTVTESVNTITIGNGTDPGNSSITLGQTAALDAFTLTASPGAPTVGDVTVALTNPAAVSSVTINGAAACNGTSYGSAAAAASTVIPTSGLTANGGTYYVCVTGATVGANTNVTGNVSSVTATGYTVTDNDTGSATITVTPPPSLTIGNSATGEAATTIGPGSAEVVLDAFTLTAQSGTANPTSITVTMPAGSAALIGTLTIENTSACNQATPYGTITNPASDTAVFTISGLSVGPTATNLWVCLTPKSHAAMPAVPGSQVAVTGRVTTVVASGYAQAGSDTVSAARTIDNLSPSNATWGTVTPGNGQVVLNWTNPGTDFQEVVILRGTASVTDAPTEGASYVQGSTVGATTVRYVGNLQSFTDTGLTNGTAYSYEIFAKDPLGNYATGAQTGPHTPTGPSLTIANATAGEGTSTLAPGDAPVVLDAFALSTTSGTAAVTSVTVTMPAGSAALIGTLTVESSQACGSGTVYGSAAFPASDAPAISTSGLSVGTASVPLWVCVKPRLHADMAAPPGTQVAVTGRVTGVVAAGYSQAGSETVSPARTIDNLSPNAPAALAGTPADSQVSLSWTNPVATDLSAVVVVHDTAAVTWTPIEGATYSAGQTLGGNLRVACVVSPATSGAAGNCVDALVTNGTAYHYRAFALDVRGNYSVASNAAGPYTPNAAPTLAVGNGAAEPSSVTIGPGAAATALDAFTLTTNTGTVTPSSLSVSLTAGANALLESLSIQNTSACTQATPYGTVTSPASSTPAISLSGLSVGAGGVNLWVCARPKAHAAMAAPPGSSVGTTGTVTSVTAAGYTSTYGDAGSATVTVDNQSPAGPAAFAGTPGNAVVVLTWDNPADADLAQVVVVRDVSPVTFTPTEGATYVAGQVLSGTVTVACVRGPPLVPSAAGNCTASGLANGTAYHFRAWAKDAYGNYTALAAAPQAGPLTPTAPAVDTTTVGNGTNPANVTIAPGAAATALDAFTLQTSSGSDPVSSVTVSLAAGSWQGVSAISIQDTAACNMATPLGSRIDPGDTALVAVSGITATTTLQSYWVCVTPKAHSAMAPPPGGQLVVTGTVIAIASSASFEKSYLDLGSATVIVDNQSPANATWTTVTPGSGQVVLAWTNPADADLQSLVVLRKTGGPVDSVPAEGATYAAGNVIGSSTVRFSALGTTFTDTGLTNGTAYYYAIFARDLRGNYAVGAPLGPVFPGNNPLPVGDTTAGSTRPVVSIQNPSQGKVLSGSSPQSFRVQVRVFSPGAAIGTVQVTGNAGGAWTSLARVNAYGVAPTLGIFETSLSLAAGSYTLVARATNDGGATWINSAPVGVTVVQHGTGDGTLLVRDNSAQLCADCHAMPTHSSESTGSTYGSWSVVCRDCHTPHGTKNIYLVPPKITPPPVGASVPAPKDVFFSKRSGYSATGGAANPPGASYANGDGTGPCQVCHTRTKYYLSDGTLVTHNPNQRCTNCHQHGKGLGAVCTDCHGSAGRTGTVARVEAAPPVDTTGASTGVKVGAHLPHVTQTTYRTSPLACSECHPAANEHNGTRDAGWSALGTGNGTVVPTPPAVNGAYDAAWEASPTCTNYCHGASLLGGGGSITSPSWTGTNQAVCGSCHGAPPPVSAAANEDHPQNTTCASCHGAGYATGGLTAAAKATHVDGTIQKPAVGCTACHGVLAGPTGPAVANTDPTAAPGSTAAAADTKGNTARTAVGVGAHVKHVNTGLMGGKSCTVCHGTPLPPDTAHANGTVGAGWSIPASAGGVTPAPASFTAAWEAAPSCTNYCHSNATPLGGTSSTVSVSWTSTTALGCTSCHGDAATGTLSARHARHLAAGTYGMDCTRCHDATGSRTAITNPANHVDGTKTIAFGLVGAVDQSSASYTGTGSTPNYTCNSSYCHSSGQASAAPFGGPARTTLNWLNGTANADCADCHGGNSSAGVPLASGSHTGHVNNATYIGTNFGCVTCHANTVSADRTIANYASHVNGSKDVTAASWNGTTCASNYCHSTGQETPAYVSVTWGTSLPNDCKQCHGREGGSVAGEPRYANNTATVSTRNSHPAHVSSAGSCVACHAQTVDVAGALLANGNHLNGNADNISGAAIGSYTPATETCNSVACHGGGSPQWGGPSQTCSACHLAAASVGTNSDVDDYVYSGGTGTAAAIDREDWQTYGHGATAAYAESGNPAADLGRNGAASVEGCMYCHAGPTALDGANPQTSAHGDANNPFRLANVGGVDGKIGVCLVCHEPGSAGYDPDGAGATFARKNASAATKISATHYGDKHQTNGKGGQVCWDCHDPHGDYNYGSARRLAYMFQERPVQTHVAADPNGWGIPNPATELAPTPDFRNDRDGTAGWAWGDYVSGTLASGTYRGVCQVCHTATGHYRNASLYDAATHNPNTLCVTCHKHEMPPTSAFAGESSGGQACTSCHTGIVSAMTTATNSKHSLVGWTDTPTDSGGNWAGAATLDAIPPASRSCVNMCHGDHPHGLTSPATTTHETNLYADPSTAATRDAANRTSATRTAAEFDPTTGTGMCTKCHAKPISSAAGRPTITDAGFGASAHDFTATATPAYTWSYGQHDGSTNPRNCTKCHASRTEGNTPVVTWTSGASFTSVHGTSDPTLLAGTKNPNGTAAGFVCYNCHGSSAAPGAGAQGNRSGKDVQTQIGKTSNHPANADGVHDSTSELGAAAFGNTLGGKARHASCMDCHEPHRARAGTHAVTTNVAGPPLEGTWGAALTTPPAFWTSPTSGSFTKKAIAAGTDPEATLCFKCHSSFYGTLPTAPSGGYAETDTAKEFNPNNAGNWFTTGTTTSWTSGETAGGFHPVLASAGNNLGQINMANLVTTNFAWRTSGARNLMTCSDCHESNAAADPNGPHGSTAGFILRGPNTLWNNTMVATSTGMPAGAFCANCHSSTYASSRFATNNHTSRSNHRVNCWNCHARIPHGGPRPGMLVAGAGANANVGGVIAGWDQTAPYWGGATSNRLYIQSYPSSPTAQWSQNNCGCNGTGH